VLAHHEAAQFRELERVDRLIYRSNRLGADQRITNTGAEHLVDKSPKQDPLTAECVEVLGSGSGGDLRTSTKENFVALSAEAARPPEKLCRA